MNRAVFKAGNWYVSARMDTGPFKNDEQYVVTLQNGGDWITYSFKNGRRNDHAYRCVAGQITNTTDTSELEAIMDSLYTLAPNYHLPPKNKNVNPHTESEEDPECVICIDAPPTYIIAPCGHKCVCEVCARKIEMCPLCRGEVENVFKVYE